jgi:RHS repeat-associated protein
MRARLRRTGAAFSLLFSLVLVVAPHAQARHFGGSRLLMVHLPATTYTSNTTWTFANSPYVLDGDVTVAAGATLTIEPGVIVKFNGQFRTLRINGTLSAVGTESLPITFTSYQDDSAGGDTNGDGNATSGAPGQWYSILFYSNTSQVKYSTVRYGGYGSAQNYGPISLYGTGYAVTLDHDTISDNQQSAVTIGGGSSATISNSILTRNKYGVYVNNASATIDHSTISNNTSRGVWFNLPTFSIPPATSITSSDITGNTSYGVYIGANGDYPLASMPKASGNNIYANNSNGIQLTVVGYPSFKRADVNWRGNYWGDGVYFWYDASLCTGTAPYSPGHLAYRSSGGNVPAGPIDGGSYLVFPDPNHVFYCGYDAFKVDAGDFSPTRLDTGLRVGLNQTFGVCGQIVHAYTGGDCQSDPVQSATGNFTDSSPDLSLPGTGVPFAFTRSYNSLDLTKGELGQGWTDTYSASLTIKANGDVTLRAEDGQQVEYTKQGDGSFVGAAGALSTLASVNGGYELTRSDQQKYRFDGQGRLTSIVDRNGQGLTVAYGADGKVSTVTDAAGRQATFIHNGNGLLTGISLPDGRNVTYGYTNGLLTSYTDPGGKVWTYTYETHGFLEKEIDPLNHTVYRNVYGADGRVAEQYDALNNKTTFSWDQATQTTTETDARGNAWKDVYANNVLVKRIDPQAHTTQFGYDSGLDRTSVMGPSGESVISTFDSHGNVLSVTAPASLGGAQKTFAYNSRNDVTSVTDPRGTQTTYGYDGAGNLTQATQAGAAIAQFAYDANGDVSSSTDARGNTTSYTYDANGNLTAITDPLNHATSFSFDAAGRLLSTTDAKGHTTSQTYDANGHVLTSTDALGNVTTNVYDAAGNLTSTTDAAGHTTTFTYDAANRLLTQTAADGGVTAYAYDSVGNKVTETDPRSHVTSRTYDADNRLASVTTPLGEKTTYSYDQNGNLASVVDPRGNVTGANPADYTTSYTYDAAGRLLSTTDPLGHVTSYTYDPDSNQTAVTDPNNHTTSYAYDGRNRLTSVTAPDGGVASYTYDGAGNVLSRTDANGHTTTNVYDAAGELVSTTSALGQTWTYTYDAVGNLLSRVDPNGNATQTAGDGTTTYTYDANDALKTIAYSDSTPGVQLSYDAVGNRASMTDGSGTVTYGYDNVNRLTSVTRGADSFSYAYDLASNLTSRGAPGGNGTTTYSYDNDNRLATATVGGATTSYGYDAAGNLVQTTLPSGNGYVETRSYDRAGRLYDVTNAKGGTTLSEHTATLDAVGNPTQIVRSGATNSTMTYGYDANDRLTSVCFQAGTCPNGSDPFVRWTYDAAGNRLSEVRPTGTTNYTYNAGDELTAAGSTSYTYDQNGNETSAGSQTFTYDLENRLKTATSGSTTTTYLYDGEGNRLQASTGALATQKTNFFWDTNNALPQLVLEQDGNGSVLRRYYYGARRLSMVTPASSFYYHYDLLGSVTNVTDASGTPEWTDSYEPFGAIRSETQNDPNAPTNYMKFAGEYADPTGLYYLRARQYDPGAGRFLSVDPIQRSADTQEGLLYAYASDNPLVSTDPSGLCSQTQNTDFTFMAYESVSRAPCGASRKSNYVNPFGGRVTETRVDQGVDFAASPGVPIKAIGRAYVEQKTYDPGPNGWYGWFLEYRLLDGLCVGKRIYVAESITPTVKLGRTVAAGRTIARFTYGEGTGIETGWAAESPSAREKTRSAENGTATLHPHHANTPEGYAFARFLHALGVPLDLRRFPVPNLVHGAQYR